jgi:hypothetical protein
VLAMTQNAESFEMRLRAIGVMASMRPAVAGVFFGRWRSETSLAARAQQPTLPVIGYLSGLGRNDRPELVDAFHHGLGELGYAEGRNVATEYRFAENQFDRLPES